MPLSDVQRADIRGMAAEGQSCTTIAAALGLSVGAVAGSLNGGRHTKVDAALIDRIRLLADEGMDQRRIASTIGLSESTVAKHMPRGLRLVASTPPPANGSAPVSESFDADPGEPLLEDLTSSDHAPQVAAHDMTVPPTTVESGADHAETIPPAIPEPDPAPLDDVKQSAETAQERKPTEDDEPVISPSELRLFLGTPSTDDMRARYVEALLAYPGDRDSIRDRIERALGIAGEVTPDDRDFWAEGYRRALGDILDAMSQIDTDRLRSKLTERIARLAITTPQA